MARGHAPSRGRSGALHNKEWTAVCIDGVAMDIAIGNVEAFSLFVADEAETLLRTRGQILAHFDPGAINESATIAVGIGVVSARAVAAGTAFLPRPATEGSYPWLWHGWLLVSSFGVALTDVAASPAMVDRLEVDSKAMRKLKETEVLALVFEVCESTDITGVVRLRAGFRVLTGD